MQMSTQDQYSGQSSGRILAWVNFNGSGTIAIRKSYNVSSITDLNPGQYTVNFINPMPDTDYVGFGASGGLNTGHLNIEGTTRLANRTTTGINIACTTGAATAYTDPPVVNFCVLR